MAAIQRQFFTTRDCSRVPRCRFRSSWLAIRLSSGKFADILTNTGKEVRCAANVMPRSGQLAVEDAREEIRKLFMDHITRAKGLDGISGLVPVILPTPMAVLQGALLGAQGTEAENGWGDLLVVDVGGATTDVHSIGYGQLSGPQIVEQGLPEAYAKRTVEGDLGIRFNAGTLRDRIGLDEFEKEFRARFPNLKCHGRSFQPTSTMSVNRHRPFRGNIGRARWTRSWRVLPWIWRWNATSEKEKELSRTKVKLGSTTAKT